MGMTHYAIPPSLSLVSGGGAALSVGRQVNLLATGLVVKATPGAVYGWHIYNAAAAVAFVKLYDKATAAVNTDTPILTIAVPATGASSLILPFAVSFATGIGWRATTALADNSSAAPAANDITAQLFYL